MHSEVKYQQAFTLLKFKTKFKTIVFHVPGYENWVVGHSEPTVQIK